MKATVIAAELRAALHELEIKARKLSTLNVLSNVSLVVEDARLKLYWTDYDLSIHTYVDLVLGDRADGEALTNAKKLRKTLDAFDGEDFILVHGFTEEVPINPGSKAAEKTGKKKSRVDVKHVVEVSRGSFKARLPSEEPTMAPTVCRDDIRKFFANKAWHVSAKTLYEVLWRSTYCMSQDESRMNLCGAFVELRREGDDHGDIVTLRVSSTDGHRGASVKRILGGYGTAKAGGENCGTADDITSIVIFEGVELLKKLMKAAAKKDESVRVAQLDGGQRVAFDIGETAIVVRAVQDRFPEMHKLGMKRRDPAIGVNPQVLSKAVRSMAKVVYDKGSNGAVFFDRDEGQTTVRAMMKDTEGVVLTKDVSDLLGKLPPAKLAWTFNHVYVLQAIEALDGLYDDNEILIVSATDEFSPSVWEARGAGIVDDFHIVMPMRRDKA